MRILQIVFLLSVCGCPQALRVPYSDILEIEKLSKDVRIHLLKLFTSLDEIVGLSPKALIDVRKSILFKELKIIRNKINKFNAQLEGIGSQVLRAIVKYSDMEIQLKLKVKEVNENIDFIHNKYEYMGTFISTKLGFQGPDLEDFARLLVSHYIKSIPNVLDGIHDIIAPSEDGVSTVFEILVQTMGTQGNLLFCNMQLSSVQQLVLHLYNTLALTELEGFLIIEFSYMVLKIHNKGNFTTEIESAQERFQDRTAITLKLAIEAVQSAPTEFWKCDPKKQVKNETYIEVTEFLQGYIENEEDFASEYSCMFIIRSSYKYKSQKCDSQHTFCNMNRQCKGDLLNCRTIANAKVCLAEAGTNRRYEYLEYTNLNQKGKTVGRRKDCTNTTSYKWWPWGPYNCEYFMCICHDKGAYSDRYFSLQWAYSDIYKNMVVTGVRFVKKNRIIHLQIQEGKLLPMGKIDVATVRWKPVEDFSINSKGIRNGEHYHTLTLENRGLNLDSLFVDEGQLVTGLVFRLEGTRLAIRNRVTPFDFKTGTMEVGKTLWLKNLYSGKGQEINLDNKDVPIRDPDRSRLTAASGMYLDFTHSDFDMDVAQSTVPFIDAQAVSVAQPVPLSGAGILYKGSTKFGGFLTLMIRTYNYSNVFRNAYDDHNYIYL